jgi:hypothetical protein
VRTGVIARRVGDEVVVYDAATHTAHCLNRTAALVFGAADGASTPAEIATRLAALSGGAANEHVVWAALERLAAANLLDGPLPPRTPARSRRQVLRTVGLGAAALAPAVASLVVPTPAEAAGTCIPQAACPSATGQDCWITSTLECGNGQTCQGAGVCSF